MGNIELYVGMLSYEKANYPPIPYSDGEITAVSEEGTVLSGTTVMTEAFFIDSAIVTVDFGAAKAGAYTIRIPNAYLEAVLPQRLNAAPGTPFTYSFGTIMLWGKDDVPVFWGMEVQVGEEVPLEEVCLAAQPEPGLVWKWNHVFSIPVILEEEFQDE